MSIPALKLMEPSISPDLLGKRISTGDLLVFVKLPALLKACAIDDPIIRNTLEGDDGGCL